MTEATGHPDLVALLRGELATEAVLAADAHLGDCSDCREELHEVAIGHALLAGAARTVAPQPVAHEPSELRVPPLASHRRWGAGTRRVIAASVAGCLVLAGVVALLVSDRGGEDAPGRAAYASAPLEPVGATADGAGRVEMVVADTSHTRMRVRTSELPPPAAGGYYYAWLLDPATDKMLPLGLVEPSGTATFELDDAILGAYSTVDVSLEEDDGDPAHSATSVLRGSYGAPAPS